MKIVFEDNFDYTGKPDPTKWDYEIGNNNGFGNNESQYYTNRLDNAIVEDGKLKIIAHKEEYEGFHYTSARLVTYSKFSLKYGRIDVRAKLPKGLGSWPAIWMLSDGRKEGVRWPLCGEIDIMEHVGHNQDMVHISLHSETYNHMHNTQHTHFETVGNVSDMFHVYSCDWTEEYIAFSYDNREVARFYKYGEGLDSTENGWPFDQKFYLILNIACGGNWGKTIDDSALPYVMEIDYVRMSQ